MNEVAESYDTFWDTLMDMETPHFIKCLLSMALKTNYTLVTLELVYQFINMVLDGHDQDTVIAVSAVASQKLLQ